MEQATEILTTTSKKFFYNLDFTKEREYYTIYHTQTSLIKTVN